MILFNDGWQFVKLPTGSTYADALAAAWTAVDLPHDFLIPQENNLYETADGWYRRTLHVPAEWLDKAVIHDAAVIGGIGVMMVFQCVTQ